LAINIVSVLENYCILVEQMPTPHLISAITLPSGNQLQALGAKSL